MSLVFKKINAGDTVKTNNGLVFRILTIGGKEGVFTVRELDVTLPSSTYGSSSVLVGTNVYIFGGFNGTSLDTIYKFDINTEQITTLKSYMTNGLTGTAAILKGDDIYIYGGYNGTTHSNNTTFYSRGYAFDIISETMTSTSDNAYATGYPGYVSTKNVCYMFGGYTKGFNMTEAIYKFEKPNFTPSKISTVFPHTIAEPAVIVIGNVLYSFSGAAVINGVEKRINYIYKFDINSETITKLDVTLPKNKASGVAILIGKEVYILGGNTKDIFIFDSVTETITTSDLKLPNMLLNSTAVSNGKVGYIFGGSNGSSGLNTIIKISKE